MAAPCAAQHLGWSRPLRCRAVLVSASLALVLGAVELVAAVLHSDWHQGAVAIALASAAAAAAAAAALLRSANSGGASAGGAPAAAVRAVLVAGYAAAAASAFAVSGEARAEASLTTLAAAAVFCACCDAAVAVSVVAVSLSALAVAGAAGHSFAPAARLLIGAAALASAPLLQSAPRATPRSPSNAERHFAGSDNCSSDSCEESTTRKRSAALPVHCQICHQHTAPVVLCMACRTRPLGSPPSPPVSRTRSFLPPRVSVQSHSAGEVLEKRTQDPRVLNSPTVSSYVKNASMSSDQQFFVAAPRSGRLLRTGLPEERRDGVSDKGSAGDQSAGSQGGSPDCFRPSLGSAGAEAGSADSTARAAITSPMLLYRPSPGVPTRPRTVPHRGTTDPGRQDSSIPSGVGKGDSSSPRASLINNDDQRRQSVAVPQSQRSKSLGSDTGSVVFSRTSSIVSAHGNYVSYSAQVRRTHDHGGTGFVMARPSMCCTDSDAELRADLVNADTPVAEGEDDSGRELAAPLSLTSRGRSHARGKTLRRHNSRNLDRPDPRKMSTVPSPVHSATQRNVTIFADQNDGESTPPPTRPTRGMSLFVAHPVRTKEETTETTKETRELVKRVVELDFSLRGERTKGLRPMQSLPMATLQKLVVLFGRLAEELDTFRAQQFIVACVCEVMQCDRAAIFLAEWKRQEVFFISDEGQEIHVPMEGSLAGYAALHRRVLNIGDAYSDPRFNKDVDKRTGYTTRNLLVYPIGRGVGYDLPGVAEGGGAKEAGETEVIAVIEAINKHQGPFTAEDENILALLGKQAGIHLSNAQTHQQLQLQGLKAQTLLEVSKEIADIKIDLGEMMARIMSRARQVLTVARASIFLIDEEKQELWSILTDSATAEQLGGDNVIRFPVGVGLAGHVAKTGAVLNIPDAYQHPLFNPEFDQRTGFVTKAALCVPIRHAHIHSGMSTGSGSHKIMGVMQFINKMNGDPFMEEDEELALSFSSFVAISLNNILLYDELREGQMIREKNKELEILRDQAQQAAEAKNNFLMAMSHEIRTPMGGVIGMCELLQATSLTTEQREMTDTIRSCGEALMAIINDVLDFGKLDCGKLELEQRELDLVLMMEETVDVVRSKTEGKGITLLLEIAPDLPTQVVGDEYRLRQVLTNLLGNAVKFTPEGGDVTLVARHREAAEVHARGSSSCTGSLALSDDFNRTLDANPLWLYFCVTDTGIGISEEAQGRLFRPFEQAEAGTTRQFGGSGLGLAICRQLVDAMGGTIGISSQLGHGATFWFTAQLAKAPESLTLRERLPQLDTLRVATACSHQRQCAALAKTLRLFGVKHRSAPSLPGLLEALRGASAGDAPHIVLVDEAVDGFSTDSLWEACVLLRTQRDELGDPNLLQVALVASMATRSQVSGAEGLTDVLSKPPKLAALRRLLSRALGAAPPKNVAPARAADAGAVQLPHRRKLLIAEDNPTNQLLFKKQLQGFGVVPTMCDNGQLAVDTLVEEFHDLVFMDCHMPVLDGFNATRKIRALEQEGRLARPEDEAPTRVTIVALTADALPDTRGKCVDAGMDDYITKPLRKAVLQQVLEKYFFAAREA
eukprot:TRINITY_DN4773_c5_g1_i1.p1 TRINITY_DN4773_c5_g1~~TRINITY_DN4773_c5_g1_i1.p1  ORF type:complete len:1612 (+),score=491.77 TRINITY_DN4773_c5_g1_i1:83-4837(+)